MIRGRLTVALFVAGAVAGCAASDSMPQSTGSGGTASGGTAGSGSAGTSGNGAAGGTAGATGGSAAGVSGTAGVGGVECCAGAQGHMELFASIRTIAEFAGAEIVAKTTELFGGSCDILAVGWK